jgi:hypothetical protein
MKSSQLPPREELARILEYRAVTGELLWRHRQDRSRRWNARYAGRVAGSPNGNGYLKVSIGKRLFYAHHIVWALAKDGPIPEEIDHIDRCRSNNRAENLRAATRRQNACNMGVQSRTASGLKGVYPLPSGKFCSRIKLHGRDRYLGSFETAAEAHAARKKAGEQLHGEFARS